MRISKTALITFGAAALSRLDEPKVATETIERLRDKTDLTGLVVVWSSQGPIVAEKHEPISPLSISAYMAENQFLSDLSGLSVS